MMLYFYCFMPVYFFLERQFILFCLVLFTIILVEYISNLVADLIHEIGKQFMTRISRIKLIMWSTKTVDKHTQSGATTISRNSSNILIRKKKNTYGAVAVAAATAADPLTSPMSMKRLAMSGKKSSLGNNSNPVVVRVRSPKTWLPLSRTGSQEVGFRRPIVTSIGARQKLIERVR